MSYKILEFDIKGDEKGHLIAFEEDQNVPFEIKRVFYIFGTQNGVARGNHANRNTKFLLISVSGSCKVDVFDGQNKETISLDKPNKGLFMDKMVWKKMYAFSPDCVLLALASEYYDENEYIRNHDDFLKELLSD